MRVLGPVNPTPEQLTVIRDYKPGITVIRGAAGSGKTTTALVRLNFLAAFWRTRRAREALSDPVRIRVLTYNRTLSGYIAELAEQQTRAGADLDLQVSTFAKWARANVTGTLVQAPQRRAMLTRAGDGLLEPAFLISEVDYLLGRFDPSDLEDYIDCRRENRGSSPRVDASLRRALLDEVVYPYEEWKTDRGLIDFNDLAVRFRADPTDEPADVVIVDEAQDFSANEARAVLANVADDHSVTFVIDAAQRIYPRHFKWREIGVSAREMSIFRLSQNYRNTREIAVLARAILDGLTIDDDGSFPNFESCTQSGEKAVVLEGTFARQVDYVLQYLSDKVDLSTETAAFLHPRGGDWFDYLRRRLQGGRVAWVELTQQDKWPAGPTNVALSTMHSAKGLEFDHVFLLGLNEEVTPHGSDPNDDTLENLRRLLAMGVGRARRGVVLGYKPGEASDLFKFVPNSAVQREKL